MADGAVSYAMETVGKAVVEETKLLCGVKRQVKDMESELRWMNCFLKDAETRKGETEMVRIWVSEIREAAYEAEDVIERFVLKSALRNRKDVMNRMASLINHTVELHQVGSRIASIKTNLNNLKTKLQTYGIIKEPRAGKEQASNTRQNQEFAHVTDHNVIGLDDKITELAHRLLDPKQAPLLCLHGMGGIGKTTAAKKLYNDTRIRSHFQGFAWVYVSQHCNTRQVWESILSQLSDKNEEVKSMSEDELASQLCGVQKERRCLVIVDDIWRSEDWCKLSPAFPYMDRDGRSKILVTSRNRNVASHHGVYCTSLSVLDHNNSLELLKNTILFLGGPNHPLRYNLSMDKSAEEMVKQCAGLPLAIVVLGAILATKLELFEWERVADNIKLVLKRGDRRADNGVASVLETSYQDLPYYLKSCFLHFSQYLEDEAIKSTDLIQRWVGEGFVTEDGDKTMEDVAEEYLNELVCRCMIQVGERGHTGRVKTCRVHDLMRDLCISKAKEEGFAHTIDLRVENEVTIWENSSRIHRLCVLCGESDEHNLGAGQSMLLLSTLREISPKLRSVSFRDFDEVGDGQVEAIGVMMKKLKLVRVLELSRSDYPNSNWKIWRKKHIGNLIHLRLLKLRYAEKLPTSVSNLRYLQTLKLETCLGNLEIPDSLWGMEQLRHLHLPRVHGGVCESSNQRASNLRNLQTLVNFPPEKFDLQRNMAKLTSVRKLVINFRWEESDKISSQEIAFNRLHSLTFEYKDNDKYVDLEDITRGCPRLYRLVIERRIKFPETAATSCNISIWPKNLTKIVLRLSFLNESHMGPLAKLQSLKVLFLDFKSFVGREMVFRRDDFPRLCHLHLQYLEYLEEWSVHEGGLPSLSCLEIFDCRKLKSVPEGSQFMKELKELKVSGMHCSFKRRLEQGGEDWDRVSHVASVSFSNIYSGM